MNLYHGSERERYHDIIEHNTDVSLLVINKVYQRPLESIGPYRQFFTVNPSFRESVHGSLYHVKDSLYILKYQTKECPDFLLILRHSDIVMTNGQQV